MLEGACKLNQDVKPKTDGPAVTSAFTKAQDVRESGPESALEIIKLAENPATLDPIGQYLRQHLGSILVEGQAEGMVAKTSVPCCR